VFESVKNLIDHLTEIAFSPIDSLQFDEQESSEQGAGNLAFSTAAFKNVPPVDETTFEQSEDNEIIE